MHFHLVLRLKLCFGFLFRLLWDVLGMAKLLMGGLGRIVVVVQQLIKEQEQKLLRTQKCRQLGALTLLTQEKSASSYWFLKLLLNPSFHKIYFAASGFMDDLSYHNRMKRIQPLEIYFEVV